VHLSTENTMDNENYSTEKMQPIVDESGEKSEILTDACTTMKAEIKDEAQHFFADRQGNIGKPQTLTEVCTTMKAEIKDEAKRLVPDLGNR
jgi:hypothetical protein